MTSGKTAADKSVDTEEGSRVDTAGSGRALKNKRKSVVSTGMDPLLVRKTGSHRPGLR